MANYIKFRFSQIKRNKLLLSISILLFFHFKLSITSPKVVDYGSYYIPADFIESKLMNLRNVSKFFNSSWEMHTLIIAPGNYLKRLRILSRYYD